MSRTRRIVGATAVGYLHQATIVVVGLWLTPFLLRRIGQHDLGLWLVAGQLLGYIALMDLGVIAILPREVAFASGQQGIDTRAQIADLIAAVRRIVRWQLVGLGVACVGIWLLLPAEWESLRWPLAWVFAAFVVCYPLRVPAAALQGLQDLPFLAVVQMVGWALSTAVTILLVLFGARLSALVAGWVAGLMVPAIAATWRLRRQWRLPRGGTGSRAVRPYFNHSMWVSVSQIAQVLVNGSDVLLVGRLLGAAAVVPYSCTGKLITVFANHPQLLMHAAQPALTELRASGTRDHLARVSMMLSQAMLIMSGALVVVIIPVNQFFVHWWVGTAQYGGTTLTVAFALMMLLRHWNVAVVYTLFCFGYERQISMTSLVDGVVAVVATPLLVLRFGAIGAPIASMLGVALVSLPVNLRSVALEMGLDVRTFLRPFATLMGLIVASTGAAVAATVWIAPSRFVPTIMTAALMSTCYGAIMVPLVWRSPLRNYIDAGLVSRFRRRPPDDAQIAAGQVPEPGSVACAGPKSG